MVVIGEMRDLETIETALIAAETGHLVMATLHTPDSVQTIQRIYSVFPPAQQNAIIVQLANSLQAIVAQKLLPRADGSGRILACEICIATAAVRNIIREHRFHQLYNEIQTGAKCKCRPWTASCWRCTRRATSPTTWPCRTPASPNTFVTGPGRRIRQPSFAAQDRQSKMGTGSVASITACLGARSLATVPVPFFDGPPAQMRKRGTGSVATPSVEESLLASHETRAENSASGTRKSSFSGRFANEMARPGVSSVTLLHSLHQ